MRWITHLGGARATLAVGLALVALGEPRLGLTALLANAGSHVFVQLLKRAVARSRSLTCPILTRSRPATPPPRPPWR